MIKTLKQNVSQNTAKYQNGWSWLNRDKQTVKKNNTFTLPWIRNMQLNDKSSYFVSVIVLSPSLFLSTFMLERNMSLKDDSFCLFCCRHGPSDPVVIQSYIPTKTVLDVSVGCLYSNSYFCLYSSSTFMFFFYASLYSFIYTCTYL